MLIRVYIMPYQVQGSAQNIFDAFNLRWAVENRDDPKASHISIDLERTHFFGTQEQARHHLTTWQNEAKPDFYFQGNMSAANLYLVFGAEHYISEAKHNSETWDEQFIYINFAYVNDAKELCALTFISRRDDPTQWFIGLIENSHLEPQERWVTLLTSFDVKHCLVNAIEGIRPETVEPPSTPLEEKIKSKSVSRVLEEVIDSETSEVDLRCARISLLLSQLNVDNTDKPIQHEVPMDDFIGQVIYSENKALDLVAYYQQKLSLVQLQDCLSESGSLRQAIENIKFGDNYKESQAYLRMLLIIYGAEIQDFSKDLLADTRQLHRVTKYLENPDYRNLIIDLLKQEFAPELFEIMTQDAAYFIPVPDLVDYGLQKEDLINLYAQPRKLSELQFIHTIHNESCKKLCLIFLIKGELSLEEYKAIVNIINKTPDLADTLIAKDKTGTVAIDDLKLAVFDELRRQVITIKHSFASEFEQHKITKEQLKTLSHFDSEDELIALADSLSALKEISLKNPYRIYSAVLKKDAEGQIVRVFLSQLAKVEDVAMRQELIEFFFIGIPNKPVSQANALKELNNKPELLQLARDVHERFLCTKQIQDLDFNAQVVKFTAEKTENAGRFRQVILQVEEECKRVHQKLSQSWDPNRSKNIVEWQNAHEDYRKTLYALAYEQLTAEETYTPQELKVYVKQAEAKVLAVVDPKIQSWLYLSLVIIANILITALTVGVANYYKEKNTGNYWFFNRTPVGEMLTVLDDKVYNNLLPPGS